MSVAIQAPPPNMERLARQAFGAGILGVSLSAAGGLLNPAQFFRSWLLAWIFVLALALGSLGVLMLQHLSGGAWGIAIRRILEAATRTLPVVALLFVPLLFGLKELYVWARPEAVAADEVLLHKSPYLNVTFFIVRAIVYFAIWGVLAWALNQWSLRQDTEPTAGLDKKLTMLSAPGIILYVLTVTFASVDWLMSLEPHWFSTIYGVQLVASQALAGLAFAIAVLFLISEREPMSRFIAPRHFHDLGKLLLAFVMVWSYFAFSQFLIIWAGNLPEEIPWYLRRLQGGWQWVGLSLIVLQYAAPFLLLLSRNLKRSRAVLAKVALLVVVMRLVDILWMTAPVFHPGAFFVHWMDLAAPVGLGGLWLAAFVRQLQNRPLLPLGDPYLAEAIGHAYE